MNSKYNGIGKWIAIWASILTIAIGGGIWAGEIQNEQTHKADKAEVAALKKDMEYLKADAEEAKEERKEILKAIQRAHQ